MPSIVILISGRGSNMEAILDAGLGVDILGVISNRPGAGGLTTAATRGVPTFTIDHKAFADRAAFDAALADQIDKLAPDFIVLAGFMRVLTADFIHRYPRRILNIHPSLLPAFTGLNTHQRALDAGVKIHGCTVHFVTPELDHGPIIVQAAVPVLPDDTEASLAARVLQQEHLVYPRAIRWLAEDRIEFLAGERVRVRNVNVTDGQLVSP